MAISLTQEKNITIMSITSDAVRSHIAAMELLGANFHHVDINPKLDERFTNGQDIYFLLDACHMLKLSRNALEHCEEFIDGQGRPVKWEHLKLLANLQKQEGMKFGTKISTHHVNFKNQVMKVKLASQLFSSSCADALQMLMDWGTPGFEDCSGTIAFLRIMDKQFDLLNARNRFGKGLKRTVTKEWYEQWRGHLRECNTYLYELKDKTGEPMHGNHPRRTFCRGFMLTNQGILHLAHNLLFRPHRPFKHFATYKTSQDREEH